MAGRSHRRDKWIERHFGGRQKKLLIAVGRLKSGIPLFDNEGQLLDDVPSILWTYLFCSPSLDLQLRCLPRAGGFYDQYVVDMFGFQIIEGRLREIMAMEARNQPATPTIRMPNVRMGR